MKTNTLFILAILSTALSACKQAGSSVTADKQDQASSPKAGITNSTISAIQPEEYQTVDAINGGTVTFESGSRVHFPDNCFETLNGDEIKGKVMVEWKEYHTLGEIMCSDISMKYEDGVLSSGGMFEISGTDENHNLLRIKKGKSFTVDLLSERKGIEFPFFSYDTISETWTEAKAKESSDQRITRTKSISDIAKIEGHIFSIPVSTKGYNELKDEQIIGWYTEDEFDFFAEDQSDLSSYLGKLVGPVKDSTYTLVIKKGKERKEYQVKPVTVKNQSEFIKEEYLERAQKLKVYMEDYRNGKVERTARLENFGTYNWDILHAFPDNTPLFCRFQHGNQILEVSKAYFVIPSQQVSIPLNISGDRFHLIQNARCGLVMIYPDKTVAIINKSDIKSMLEDQQSAKTLIFEESNIYTFEKVTDIDELINKHI